jgi:hypothetical protein
MTPPAARRRRLCPRSPARCRWRRPPPTSSRSRRRETPAASRSTWRATARRSTRKSLLFKKRSRESTPGQRLLPQALPEPDQLPELEPDLPLAPPQEPLETAPPADDEEAPADEEGEPPEPPDEPPDAPPDEPEEEVVCDAPLRARGHEVKRFYQELVVVPYLVGTKYMAADMYTKALDQQAFFALRDYTLNLDNGPGTRVVLSGQTARLCSKLLGKLLA